MAIAGDAVTPRRRADSLTRAEQGGLYVILLLASLGYNYNFIIVDYIRPFLVRHVGMSLADTAWLYSAQGTGVIAGSFLVPILVARFGSRPVLGGASFALAVLTAANEAVVAFAVWAVLRFAVGIALAGAYISATTMLANFFPPRLRGRLLSANMAMFSVALLVLGSLGAALGEDGWRLLVRVGALLPLAVAVLTFLLLPDDRAFVVYADRDEAASDANLARGRWGEMLQGGRLWLTVACLVLAGLNFSSYQFYSGFITTYLLTERHFDATITGLFVTVDGIGTFLGTLAWGICADRFGRRANAAGFLLAAACTALMLVAPRHVGLLVAIELVYAIGLSCTNCWAAFFAELFPVRLRPMGTSLFHGGHIVSLFAPLIVALAARHASLPVGMALAPLCFLLAAGLWLLLPETLRTSPFYRGFVADPGAGIRP